MFKRTKVAVASAVVAGCAVQLPVQAQTSAAAPVTQRIEITGSAIKRIDAETTVPLTILRMQDLKAQGVTTIEQVISQLAVAQVQQGSSQQVGAGTGGASFADLRGIGANKTLVLLNGRRVANNAIDGSATDLNVIPFAALDRVEVLRDGASSLYGTDAIGGVINFITRNDYRGGSITLGADIPEEQGGKQKSGNIGFGFGDLNTDRFNVFGFLDVNKTNRITGTDRPFNARFPGGLSPTPFPANYYQSGDITANPAAPACTSPSFLTPAGDNTSCLIKTSEFVDYTPDSERISGFLRGTLRLGEATNLSVELFKAQNTSTTEIAPVPYGVLRQNRLRPNGTPNPYYPGNPGSAFSPAFPLSPTFVEPGRTLSGGLQPGYLIVKWRALEGGSRQNESLNKQQRFLVSLDGAMAGWDYQLGLSYNENKITESVSGYTDGVKITRAVQNGVINPFGTQDAAGTAAIQDAILSGNLQNHRGIVKAVDGRVSRELGDWFRSGRSAAVAVGGEFRKEDFISAANPPVAELLVASTGVDPDSRSEGKRDVSAVYAELSVPILRTLEATAAVRYDKYSDFGDTVNPKFSLRYQPLQAVVVRGSYSTGFRAPSLYELNATPSYTNTGTVNDPINCPGGSPIAGKSRALNCNVQFQRLTGGNTSLQPEEAKNYTLGIVLEPVANLTFGLDFWWIRVEDTIAALSENTVLGDAATFGSYIKRNASGNLSIDGTACPGADCGYLDLRQQNLGNTKTNGVDITVNYRQRVGGWGQVALGLNGTHVRKYEYQDFIGGPYNQNVGVYVGTGPIFRNQYTATASWTVNSFTVGAVGRYKSGYVDQDPENNVGSYATGDAYVTWSGIKGLGLTFGVKNFTDRDPPYSNQGEVFQANYDPRFADPTGRAYYVRAAYSF